MRNLYFLLPIVLIIPFVTFCKKEKIKSSEKEILTFTLTQQTAASTIDNVNHLVIIEVGNGTDLSNLQPVITLSEKATCVPQSGAVVDFRLGPVTYIVTAEDGSSQEWRVSVTSEKSSAAFILSFSVSTQISAAVFNDTSISLTVSRGTNLSDISPTIIVSPGATVNPSSGTSCDFSSGSVIYTVTAEDESIQKWVVTIEVEESSEAKILNFSIPEQIGTALVGDSTIIDSIPPGVYLSKFKPTITVSPYATISPVSGDSVDFSSGTANYTVTAEDGTIKIWKVTIVKVSSSAKDIVTFSVDGLVGTVQKTPTWISCEVDFTQDITAIAPDITVSPGATISPASGEAVDFTSGFYDYIVTADNASFKKYRVYINYSKISADNPNYQYFGRIDFTDPLKPRFWASGVYIKAKFTGTYCGVAINDEVLWGNSHNYLEFVIDDNEPIRLQTTGATNNIKLADNLSAGEHTITICKNTESAIGYLEFVGLRVAELLPMPGKPMRKIECIGNSITCGAKSDNSVLACGAGDWYGKDNAYMSYGAEVARRLNAQYHLSSVSGIGLIHSCCGMTQTMPDVYGNLSFNQTNNGIKAWDFSQYVPDVVTISLGQNDGVQDSATFCSAYVDFIGTVRTNYPDAHIVCLTSPMGDATLTNALKKYLIGIVNYMNTNGDAKVHKYYFSKSWNAGCDSHPSVAQHQEIATELETELKSIMGW